MVLFAAARSMRSNTWDEKIHGEHRAYILNEEVQAAFDEMIAVATQLPTYETQPVWQNSKRSFRYEDPGTAERPFAFIVNQHSLLFYVRLAGTSRIAGGLEVLQRHFPTASANPTGEWTVRIANLLDAKRINAYMFDEFADGMGQRDLCLDGITSEDAKDTAAEEALSERTDLPATVIETLIKARRPRRLPRSGGGFGRTMSSDPH